jgi:hypothetical protein
MYNYKIGLIFTQHTVDFYGLFNPMNTGQLKINRYKYYTTKLDNKEA